MTVLETQGLAARHAARALAVAGTARKNAALEAAARTIEARQGEILAANAADLEAAMAAGLRPALLDRLRIPYAWVAHETADTIADCDVVSEVLGISICKNLFLCNRQKTAFYLLTMPGGKPFQTKVLSAQLGTTRLSFAPPELMESMLRCTPGSASVLGLAYDTERRVRLVMDRAVHDAAWFGCHPCKNDASLRLRTEDLLHVFLPHTGHDVTVVDL